MKNSVIVEVKNDKKRERDYFIRKKALELKEKYVKDLGYDIERIKELKRNQFENFIEEKNNF
jgi:5-formaminoimidazole-4-carboxamide-1-beta-D-ribofuranosyl 5'-monophosphate synthetase